MTRAIAIETSGKLGSAALVEDGEAVAEEAFPHGLQHAAMLVPMLDRLCAARGWTPADAREIYVSAGPGSFTGLRVGITLAKTLAFATGAKIVAVPSVRVLAENAPADAQQVVIVLDAKRGQIFTARFERGEVAVWELPVASGPQALPATSWREAEPAHLDTLAAMISRMSLGSVVHLIGEGIPQHRDSVENSSGVTVIETPPEMWSARASVVARLGHEMARQGEFADALRLTPIYIRLPEAEEKWIAQQSQK